MSDANQTTLQFTPSLTPAAIETVKTFGWDFFRAGVLIADEWPPSSVHFDEGRAPTYLLVREAKVKETQPDGSKRWVLSDQGKWNLPCGRLQVGETFEQAALREGQEESGHKLRLEYLCHIGHRTDPDNPYVIFIYSATNQGFGPEPDPEEIAETKWFTYDDIVGLRDNGQLRNPDLTMTALNQYRDLNRARPGFVITYPPK